MNLKFQMIYREMEWFIKTANAKSAKFLQSYIDEYQHIFLILSCSPYCVVISVILVPLLIEGVRLPVEAVYPFATVKSPVYELVYAHQLFTLVQFASCMCTNNFITFLVCTAVSRLDLLSTQFRNFKNKTDFCKCVRTHQKILR